MLRLTYRLLLLVAVMAIAPAAVQACPGCKEATSEQGANMARGYSYSILFMMPIPFIILGSFGGYVYYTVRKREGELTPPVAADQVLDESPSQ